MNSKYWNLLMVIAGLIVSPSSFAGPITIDISKYARAQWEQNATSSTTPTGSKNIRIAMRLPEGDTMKVQFSDQNGMIIVNPTKPVTTPTVTGTVPKDKGYLGIQFSVAPILNNKKVKNIEQEHTNVNLATGRIGTLQLAAFVIEGQLDPPAWLSDWLLLHNYVGDSWISVPDFISSDFDIYYGIDLAQWVQSGFTVDDSALGTQYSIINGFSSSLPGVLFSTTPLEVGQNGWQTASVYSGVVTLDAFHALSVIPEPSMVMLIVIGILALDVSKRFDNAKRTMLGQQKYRPKGLG